LKRSPLGRGAVVAAVASFALVVGTPAPASAALDPKPAEAAAGWLAGELTGGRSLNEDSEFYDYGLTVDTWFALDAAGTEAKKRRAIVRALKDHVEDYITPFGSRSAGATAKLLVLAKQADARPRHFGGVDLVKRLRSQISSGGADDGRVADDAEMDYANTIGQAFAVTGLARIGSPSKAATEFLLKQQCGKGFFRLIDGDATTNPKLTCAGGKEEGNSDPDVDATAYALKALLVAKRAGTSGVGSAIKDAVQWLLSVQGASGAFGGAGPTSGANSNSTGLAGDALAAAGKDGAAADAARCLRRRQVPTGVGGELRGEGGTVAYNEKAYRVGKANGITKKTSDQWRRATAQATLGLTHLPLAPEPEAVTAPEDARVERPWAYATTGAAIAVLVVAIMLLGRRLVRRHRLGSAR